MAGEGGKTTAFWQKRGPNAWQRASTWNRASKRERGWICMVHISITPQAPGTALQVLWSHVRTWRLTGGRLTWSLRWRWKPVRVGCRRSSHCSLHLGTPEPRSGRSARWEHTHTHAHNYWSGPTNQIPSHNLLWTSILSRLKTAKNQRSGRFQ